MGKKLIKTGLWDAGKIAYATREMSTHCQTLPAIDISHNSCGAGILPVLDSLFRRSLMAEHDALFCVQWLLEDEHDVLAVTIRVRTYTNSSLGNIKLSQSVSRYTLFCPNQTEYKYILRSTMV
jgi:hypothetical protein